MNFILTWLFGAFVILIVVVLSVAIMQGFGAKRPEDDAENFMAAVILLLGPYMVGETVRRIFGG